MIRKTLVPFLICFTIQALGQSNADCGKAIEFKGSEVTVELVNGPGEVLEIKGHELGNDKYFTEEHNTVWVHYKASSDGELSFDLIPKNVEDDWDFMLFRAGGAQCAEIAAQRLEPVRSNLARNNPALKGQTGLAHDAEKDFQPAGVHPNYCKSIAVVSGDELMLAIDINKSSGNGFTLNFNLSVTEGEKEVVQEEIPVSSGFEFMDMTEEEVHSSMTKIKFIVLAEGTTNPVSCNAEVVGVQWTAIDMKYSGQSEFEIEIPSDKWFYFNVTKEGYTFSSEKYKASPELANSPHTVYISPVATGGQIILKEIVFAENTTQLLPTSVNALERLIDFMKEYPNARIRIKGHVNAPGYDNDGKVKKMSLKRAEQIKQYLVDAEIDGRRIEVEGMGNEQMIYSSPQNYEEEKANRRVEIEILSL